VSVSAERQLTSNLTASVNYLLVQGRELLRTVNINLTPPTLLTMDNAASLGVDQPVPQQLGRPVFGPARLNASWDGIFELQPTASSTYHGITMSANRRLADEIEWSAVYTWSRANDSASDFDEQPQNPYALGDEWGASRYDQRHRLVVSALFDLPIGDEEDRRTGEVPGAWVRGFSHIEIAPILTVGSGLPANVITGGDDNRTRGFPFTSRPLGVARNSWRLPASATLDVRILKYFTIKPHGKLDLVVEAFNVLNRGNVAQVNTVHGPFLTPLRSFGRPIEMGPARRLQFSVDFGILEEDSHARSQLSMCDGLDVRGVWRCSAAESPDRRAHIRFECGCVHEPARGQRICRLTGHPACPEVYRGEPAVPRLGSGRF
jgi:hypothetical protein